MFGSPGHIYIYMIYGMYYCLNIVTEALGQPSAVLIRGIQMPNIHLNGPGKICRYMAITKEHNGINLLKNNDMYLTQGLDTIRYKATSRIGIRHATDKLWRFIANPSE